MNATFNLLKSLYQTNKVWFFLGLFILVIFVTGCASQGSAPPPSGPIGGGCGG